MLQRRKGAASAPRKPAKHGIMAKSPKLKNQEFEHGCTGLTGCREGTVLSCPSCSSMFDSTRRLSRKINASAVAQFNCTSQNSSQPMQPQPFVRCPISQSYFEPAKIFKIA